jgi:hypothetical protein
MRWLEWTPTVCGILTSDRKQLDDLLCTEGQWCTATRPHPATVFQSLLAALDFLTNALAKCVPCLD